MSVHLTVLTMREAEVEALRQGNAELLAALKAAALGMPSGRARADAMFVIRKHSR